MIFIRFAAIIVLLIMLFNNNLIFVRNLFSSSLNVKNENARLELENDSLKTELYISENLSEKQINPRTYEVGGGVNNNEWEYFSSKVFSSYPFNNQNMIGIASGKTSGIQENQVVAAAPGILLGTIIKVNDGIALVRTIFDKDFIAAVKIGDNKINALLKGGIPPTLEMIEKNKDIKNGEIVYNADQNYPYGFKLGEIQLIENKNTDKAELFKNAVLKINYNPASLEDVWVVKNFSILKQ